jgi:hypothetical protein
MTVKAARKTFVKSTPGPLTIRREGKRVLVGVTSWGYECAHRDRTGLQVQFIFVTSSIFIKY